MTCSVEGCESPDIKRGFCSLHYQRWYKHGDPKDHGKYKRGQKGTPCSVANCPGEAKTHGLCGRHDTALRRYGEKMSKPGMKLRSRVRELDMILQGMDNE